VAVDLGAAERLANVNIDAAALQAATQMIASHVVAQMCADPIEGAIALYMTRSLQKAWLITVRLPTGRPFGFPDWPGCHIRPFTCLVGSSSFPGGCGAATSIVAVCLSAALVVIHCS
jgi:hypothetical protein